MKHHSLARVVTAAALGAGGLLLAAPAAEAVPAPQSGWTCKTPERYDPDLIGDCRVLGLTPAQNQYRLVAKCSNGSTRYSAWSRLGYIVTASCPSGTYGIPGSSSYEHR